MLGVRGIFIALSGIIAMLLAPAVARKAIREATQCVLKPQASPEMPPEPTQCPCGPTIVKKPIAGLSSDLIIVYEAWKGYCKSSPWLDSTEHAADIDNVPSNVACSAAAACCLSASYFMEGEKPSVREFMSCPGGPSALAAEPKALHTHDIKHQHTSTDPLQVVPEVAPGGSTSAARVQEPNAGTVDGPDALSVSNYDRSHASSGDGVMQKISQVLKGVFIDSHDVNIHDLSASVDVSVEMPISVDMLVDSDVNVEVRNFGDYCNDPDCNYDEYTMQETETEFEVQNSGKNASSRWGRGNRGLLVIPGEDASADVSAVDSVVAMRVQTAVSFLVGLAASIAISILCGGG